MIDLVIPTLRWKQIDNSFSDCIKTWPEHADYQTTLRILPQPGSLLRKMQLGLEQSQSEIVGFVHDDVKVLEQGWDTRVLAEFATVKNAMTGLVGFGGALRHGSPDLYTSPYHLPNLARGGFRSNMRDAEQHGERFEGSCAVAVLDGLAMFVRRDVLLAAGGWPVDEPYGYYMYAEWLSCAVRRLGYRIRLVGVACEHIGGRTASMVNVTDDYQLAHRYFYDHNRDVMPAEIQP
jgi:Glycosyltransferase like family